MKTMKSMLVFMLALLVLTSCNKDDFLDIVTGKKDKKAEGAIFVMTNDPEDNQLLVFTRNGGELEKLGAYSTGGMGINLSGANDPLGTQNPLIMGANNEYVFAVNAGSHEISSFKLDHKFRPKLKNVVSSGGIYPVTLATSGQYVYVGHSGEGGNISGFYIEESGKLSAIPNSTRNDVTSPGSVEFSPDGKYLIVTDKPTDKIFVYKIGPDGAPMGDVMEVPSSGVTPFGATVSQEGILLVSEANAPGGPPAIADGSTLSSYWIKDNGMLMPISKAVPTGETAACWVELNDEGSYAYTSNTPDGTISSFSVMDDGSLSLLQGEAGELGAGAFVLDTEVTGSYLWSITATLEEISVFRIHEDGSLEASGSIKDELLVAGHFTGIAGF